MSRPKNQNLPSKNPEVEIIQPTRLPAARNPEERERQLISMAMDVAEEQLRNGTASPSVITHFLKLGSEKERLEREIMASQKTLVDAKAESITSGKHAEELTQQAIEAMKSYGGSSADDHA